MPRFRSSLLPLSFFGFSILAFGACQPDGSAPTVSPQAGGNASNASGAVEEEQALPAPPASPKRPVFDTYHGVKVQDDYRWLEDGASEEVKEWTNAQDKFAREQLNALPGVETLRAELKEILEAKVVRHWGLQSAGGKIFALEMNPPKQQPFIVRVSSLVGGETKTQAVVDPNQIDTSGRTHIDWYELSPNGKILAVSMSKAGSESGDLYLYDSESGQPLNDTIVRVNGGTAGGSLAWTPDSQGFYYTRYPREGERPAEEMALNVRVYFHQLGTDPKEDRYEFGEGFPDISEYQLEVEAKTGRVLATVQKGDGGEFRHLLRGDDGKWKQFSEFGDGTKQVSFGAEGELLIVSREGAPRGKVLRWTVEDLVKWGEQKDEKYAPKLYLAEGADTVVTDFWGSPSVRRIGDVIYVLYQTGGPGELRAFDLNGQKVQAPSLLPVSRVSSPLEYEGKLLYNNQSYLQPPAWYLFDPATQQTTKTNLAVKAVVSYDGYEVRREFATSKDGTKVPVNILAPKEVKLDGNNPCLVTGYGGYGVALAPGYRSSIAPLVKRGVIYVVLNLRGGSEYGEEWHRQGNLTNKQNVFDDFAGGLQHLVSRGYTKAEKLSITGRSNGGLLMGAVLTQHPEMFTAVVAGVGIYDMLRVELSPNGIFNIPEFGTVKDKAQFEALHAYSPIHHVVDGRSYPATLLMTGANDPRVDPMQSRKMTARLQEAQAGKEGILLRIDHGGGHGLGTPLKEQIEQGAHMQAFLLDQLGVKVETPTASK